MLGYLETEVNSLKPVSGMWGDAGFSSLPSALGADFGSGGESSRMRSSNAASVEFERFFMGDLFPVSHDFDDLQHHVDSFSLSVLSLPPPTVFSTTSLNNNIAGDKSGLMGNADTNLGASQYNFPAPAPTASTWVEKQVCASELGIEKGESSLGLRASKRPKTMQGDLKPTSPRKESMKAPVKRSQKLGNKITALQQLVSPFGKTDTASVLHEAAICIKFLHQQIQVLTAPALGINSPACQQAVYGGERADLRSRGFCLVPISPTILNLAGQVALDHDESTARRDDFPY